MTKVFGKFVFNIMHCLHSSKLGLFRAEFLRVLHLCIHSLAWNASGG